MNQPEFDEDRLNRDPLGFFSLEEGYTEDDLKRAYRKVIRLFKPERFPKEFMAIRQVYERLMAGQDQERVVETFKAPEAEAQTSEDVKDDVSYQDVYEQGGESALRAHLENKEFLSANDVITFTILDDDAEDIDIIKYLIDILNDYGYHPGIIQVLRSHIQDHKGGRDAEIIDMVLAYNQSDIATYLLMHPWFRLAEQLSPQDYQNRFEQFMGKIECDEEERSSFILVVALQVSFKMSPEWLEKMMDEADFPELDNVNIDILEDIIEYRKIRHHFMSDSSYGKDFDDVIKKFVLDDQFDFYLAYTELMVGIAGNKSEFMKSIPLDVKYAVVLRLCYRMSYTIDNYVPLEEVNEIDEQRLCEVVQKKVNLLERITSKNRHMALFTMAKFFYYMCCIAIFVGVASLPYYLFDIENLFLILVTPFLALILCYKYIAPTVHKVLLAKIEKKLLTRVEQDLWGPEISELYEEFSVTDDYVLYILNNFDITGENNIEYIMKYYNLDIGLAIYSIALRSTR